MELNCNNKTEENNGDSIKKLKKEIEDLTAKSQETEVDKLIQIIRTLDEENIKKLSEDVKWKAYYQENPLPRIDVTEQMDHTIGAAEILFEYVVTHLEVYDDLDTAAFHQLTEPVLERMKELSEAIEKADM